MFGKSKIAALVAEFIGAGVLTMLVLSVQRTQLGIPLFVGLAAGLAVVMMSLAVGRVSGGHFNPAITLGMWTVRKIPTVTALLYVAMQMIGALSAYLLFRYFATNNAAVLQSFDQPAAKYSTLVLVSEAVGTAVFAFIWASAAYQKFTSAVSASMAGLGLTVGILIAGSASLGLLNPAVALGAQVWAWGTYALGPVIGAVVGINLYALLFADTATGATSAATRATATPATTTVGRPKKAVTATKKPAAKKKTARGRK